MERYGAVKQFHLPTRVITGLGCFSELAPAARALGQSALLVCGHAAMLRSGVLQRGQSNLDRAGVRTVVYRIAQGEPTLATVQAALELARRERVEVVIGIGGGSAVDVAKAVAVLYTQAGTLQDYHRGRPLSEPGLPCIAVPTTAGTGTEVTSNAVLTDSERGVKESLRGPQLFPAAAVVDPELTLSLPPAVTAGSGADALCQAIESFVAVGAQPPTDALAGQAICWIGRSLVHAYADGSDIAARSDMLYGSLLAGMALTNTRLGGVHGMAHPLGFTYHLPHGVICGLLLPYVMEYSLASAPEKYGEVARHLGIDTRGMPPLVASQQAVEAIRAMLRQIGIPEHLADLGVMAQGLPEIIEKSLHSSNLKNNPRSLGAEDLRVILERAL
jgi:alcohol dehydrogenase class IV